MAKIKGTTIDGDLKVTGTVSAQNFFSDHGDVGDLNVVIDHQISSRVGIIAKFIGENKLMESIISELGNALTVAGSISTGAYEITAAGYNITANAAKMVMTTYNDLTKIGVIAKFTADGTIGKSLISESGTVVTLDADLDFGQSHGLLDYYVTNPILLGDASNTSFRTTNKTIVGALNEVDIEKDYMSVGFITEPTFTPTINPGEVTIGSADVYLRSDSNGLQEIRKYTVPQATFTFTDNDSLEIVCVRYNNGAAEYYVETVESNINGSNITSAYFVWRVGSEVHSRFNGLSGLGLANKLNVAQFRTEPYRQGYFSNKLTIAEIATRRITITGSTIYVSHYPIVLGSFDSNSDNMTECVHTAGGWTFTNNKTQYDNTSYNPDASGKVALDTNKYTFIHYYRSIGDVKQLFYVFSKQQYTKEDDARSAAYYERDDLPTVVKQHCILIGRSIVKQGNTSGVTEPFIQSTGFYVPSIPYHGDLTGLSDPNQHPDNAITVDAALYNIIPTTVTHQSAFNDAVDSYLYNKGVDTKQATGIPVSERGKFKVSVTYNAGNVTAALSFVGANTSFSYYINGKKFTVTSLTNYTATQTAAEGVWFFYINSATTNANTPVMSLSQTPWTIIDPDVLLWNFYFNASNNSITWIGEERHTAGRDIYQHARNHAQGAIYKSGFTFSQYNGLTNLSGNTDNNFGRAQVQIAGGQFFDEDMQLVITHSDISISSSVGAPVTDWALTTNQFLGFTDTNTSAVAGTLSFASPHTLVTGQAITVMQGNTTIVRGTFTVTAGGTGTSFAVTTVTGSNAFANNDRVVVGARIPIYYISAVAPYRWRRLTTSDFVGVSGGAAITTSTIASAVCQYNDAAAGGFASVTSTRYFPVYLLATNSTSEPVIAILGQGQSTNSTLSTALAEAPFQFENLLGLSALSIQEVVPFQRLTFQYNSTAGFNQNRMRLVDSKFINVRVASVSGTVIGGGTGSMAASNVYTDTTNFNGLLTGQTTVQGALGILDDLLSTSNTFSASQFIQSINWATSTATIDLYSSIGAGTINIGQGVAYGGVVNIVNIARDLEDNNGATINILSGAESAWASPGSQRFINIGNNGAGFLETVISIGCANTGDSSNVINIGTQATNTSIINIGTASLSAISLGGNTFIPSTNDGLALGSTANSFSDLFLASGAVINFNNGNVTLTHSAGILTLAGTLALGANNLTITGSIASTGSRVTKGWFVDLECTNAIAASITGSSAKATNLVGGNNTTLLGSIPYQSNTDVTALLAPNTSTTKKFLSMTGTGTNGAVPVWDTVPTTFDHITETTTNHGVVIDKQLGIVGTYIAAGTFNASATAPTNTTRLNYEGYFYATRVYNAVWNDIADYIEVEEDTDIEFGKVYVFNNNKHTLSSKYADSGIIGISSDTYGFGVGVKNKDISQIPIAIGGFVLAHVDKTYKSGTALTSSKNGYLTKANILTRLFCPEKIIATFYKIERKEIWNDVVIVKGRHWVKVK